MTVFLFECGVISTTEHHRMSTDQQDQGEELSTKEVTDQHEDNQNNCLV